MARSSGRVTGRIPPVTFVDRGARYRLDGLSFRVERGELDERRPLQWFIGSGKVGRSFLFARDGFLFQAPVSYFAGAQSWGLSPGFGAVPHVDLAKPVEPPCLRCHATGSAPVEGTLNRYADPPFAEDGIGCQRCHGDARAHAATKGEVPALNPVKLPPAERNSVCEQCHLTGAARVEKPGAPPYRPGARLADSLAVFIRETAGAERAATDHAEQLARSRCAQASGDRLWCGTCHDPHRNGLRAGSCAGCHAATVCQRGPDCAACHLPKAASREGDHVVYTDHTIRKRPAAPMPASAAGLRSYWKSAPDPRDLAMAAPQAPGAKAVLARANDLAARVQLAQLHDQAGEAREAVALYEAVVKLDPAHPVAAANLGIYRARDGRVADAIALWRAVFDQHPALIAPGVNLALAQLGLGDTVGAARTIERLRRLHPDLPAVRELVARLSRAGSR